MGRPYFRPAHRDAAEPDIIKALRAVGASVWPISGEDVPDLLVGYRGRTILLEAKTRGLERTDKRNGKTYKYDGKLSPGQQAFQDAWRGGPVHTVYTPGEALYAIGAPVEGVLEPLPTVHADASGPVRVAREPGRGEIRAPRTGNVTPAHVVKKRK